MAKLWTLCTTLLLVTTSHSNREKLQKHLSNSQSDWSPQGRKHKGQPGENLQNQTNNNPPKERLKYQTNNSHPDDSLKHQTNNKDKLQIQAGNKNSESLQYETDNNQPAENPQYQTSSSWTGKGATNLPDQAHSSDPLNGAYTQTRPTTRDKNHSPIKGMLRKQTSSTRRRSDLARSLSSSGRRRAAEFAFWVSSSKIGGHFTDYGTRVPSVQAITLGNPFTVENHASESALHGEKVNHVITKRTIRKQYSTDRAIINTPQSSPHPDTPIQPSSNVTRTPVGEGVVWSREHGFYSVDLEVCGSTQLQDIVIPLEGNSQIEAQWQDIAKGTITSTAMGVGFVCKLRIIAIQSRFLSGKFYQLELRGDVQAALNVTIAGGKKIQHLQVYQSVGDYTDSQAMVFPSLSSELILTFQPVFNGHIGEADPVERTLTYVKVRFILLTQGSGYQLERMRLLSGIDIITSFAFDGYTRYAYDTDTMVHITGTGTMISFSHFDLQDSPKCQADRLTLSRIQYSTYEAPEYVTIWSQCGNRYIPPQVYDHHLALHFVSDNSHSRTGFKMLYTIHSLSTLPQQTESGLFNCSVSHYPDFRLHFLCNLEQECLTREDEANCFYESTDCGPSHIHTGSKCYLYLPVRHEITWFDASKLCQKQERRLVSLQNLDDWKSFNQVRARKRTSPVFVSFAMSNADAEAVFGSKLHLFNDCLVSSSDMNDSGQPSIHCAYTPAILAPHTMTAILCNSSLYVHFVLCEQKNTTTYRSLSLDQSQGEAAISIIPISGEHINLTACSMSMLEDATFRYHVSVKDGMNLYATALNSTGFFVCNLRLAGRHNHSIATVIEKFQVDVDPSQAENEETNTFMTIRDGLTDQLMHEWINYDKRDFEHAFVVASDKPIMVFHLQSEGGARSIYLQLRVFVTAEPGTDHLPHTFVPPQGGILTSFAFDGITRYAHGTYATYKLDGNGIMISFPHFDLEYEYGCQSDVVDLSVYQTFFGQLDYYTEWSKCGREHIPPKVYNTKLLVLFKTGSTQASSGFKMLYSKHLLSQLPQQLPSGLFNCSMPNYPDFQLHFHCNLEQECMKGEDEVDCQYTSTDCGSGRIDASNKCYLYLPVRRKMAWYGASQLCQSHGHRLVSPRTPSEWNTFRTITDYGQKMFGVFVGLSTSPLNMDAIYREVWRWEDHTMAFYHNVRGQELFKPTCAYLPPIYRDKLEPVKCDDQINIHYVLCEKDKAAVNASHLQVRLSDLPNTTWPDSFLHCPQGHVTHSFLSYDSHVCCSLTQKMCLLSGGDSIPTFKCDSGSWTVHYSLVCDHRQDCADGSDEKWCQHTLCVSSEVLCNNQQCVLQTDWCDGMWHCVDGSDENCLQSLRSVVPSVHPPAVVTLDGHGRYHIRALDPAQPCPVTHLRCSGLNYCLPVYLRCNGVFDCPGREDEKQCDSYTCPGFYRCRASDLCVHSQHMCDGVFQCPLHDDEWLCDFNCPQGCRCEGLAFICNQTFPTHNFPSLRYLDASGSGMRPLVLRQNHYLVRLSLLRCGLTTVDNMTLPNIRWLDLSDNELTTVDMQTFAGLTNLRVLRLAQNPLTSLVSNRVDARHFNLHMLDLSLTKLLTYHGQSLAGFPSLSHLNISHGALATISEQGLNSTPGLQILDVRGSPLDHFPQNLLRDLVSIHKVYADNFKLCCPAMLPDGFNPNDCHAPLDEIASCDDLLRSNVYRVSLWFMAVMAQVGNACSFVYRVVRREAAKNGFHVFVSNLCLADFLMGLYLCIIGAADVVYRGEYLWNDKRWRGSVGCQVAGFLSLLSSETSAFFICLITLDRFLVLRFPFSQVYFHTRSALVASALVWIGGCLLALMPLLPVTSHWRFYSQTGICIPLPITRATFKGQVYSFGLMVVFNFVLFVLIALGQLLVFLSVLENSMTGSHRDQDTTIACRLTIIVLSDFLCWFPIGLLGLLASTGTSISSELNVGLAIFVLPFNSALNPFLYTFNVFMEKRRKAAEARLLERLKRQAGNHYRLS